MDSSREWSAADAAASLRMPTPGDDKYSRGVVGLRTGSDEYPGAAVLGVEAAWRTGVGMVRYLGPAGPRDLVLPRRPETVTVAGRVQAWVIGSGMPAGDRRTPEQTATLRDILAADVPVVIDAGALDLVTVDSEVGESGAGDAGAHAPRVLTPHDREHAALRHRLGLPEGAAPAARAAAAAETARVTGAVVLLKGATTVIATPAGGIRTVTTGVPWLATAGTGDVLAGILGALLAGAAAGTAGAAPDPGTCAATAAWLHGRAAASASRVHHGGPFVALEVAGAVSAAVGDALSAS